ncbi:MAG: DNA/RNA nuclease SfsA [Candidatus Thorarchaeota archaeon]|nr:DNA/RNA nuclease SfsA [Candidatus Thorarchaeota archaeon]
MTICILFKLGTVVLSEFIMDQSILTATFLRRPNRFLGVVELDGVETYAYIPNPGRMNELMIHGRTVYLRPVDDETRKTSYDMLAIDHNGLLVSLDANLPNRFIKRMLQQHALPQFHDYDRVIPEPPLYGGRADFRLEGNGLTTMIEVKSCTLVEDRIAMFPDAVTERGARHMHHLARALREGLVDKASVIFVIQRPDADVFTPNERTDPKFARELVLAHQGGVSIFPLLTELDEWKLRFIKEIPFYFNDPVDGAR